MSAVEHQKNERLNKSQEKRVKSGDDIEEKDLR